MLGAAFGRLFSLKRSWEEAERKVFILPDEPEYEKRLDAYRRRMAEGKSKNLMRKDGE